MDSPTDAPVIVRPLGRLDYGEALARMQAFTAGRAADRGRVVADEIWLTEHPPVFTLGLDGSRAHLLAPGDIPVVATERGGQVTYHGPGQVIAYILVDLRRRRIGVRTLVDRIESGTIAGLASFGIAARRVAGAPGLYVGGGAVDRDPATVGIEGKPGARVGADRLPGDPSSEPRRPGRTRLPDFAGARKIASIGLKVSHGFSYHGVAVNSRMDLSPFDRIDPCGYPGLRMTDASIEASADFDFDTHRFAVRLGDALARAIAG